MIGIDDALVRLARTAMDRDALGAEEDLDVGVPDKDIELRAYMLVRHAVADRIDIDERVVAHPTSQTTMPNGERLSWEASKRRTLVALEA